MSLMSAAEAGETPGTSPVMARRRLRVAAAGQDGPPAEGELVDGTIVVEGRPADDAPADDAPGRRGRPAVGGRLTVTQVRVARQVRVRTLRTSGSRAGTRPADPPRPSSRAAAARAASARRVTGPRAGVKTSGVRTASVRRVSTGAVSVTAGRVRAAGVQQVSVRSASLRRAGGPPVPAAGAEPGRLRLTRRGRRVVAVLAMLVAVGAATLIWAAAAGGAQASGRDVPRGSGYGGMTQVVVEPGQTLWSIAAAAEPSASPWTVVQQIIDANALSGARVQAGQLLWVPKG
jgi:hypothetical protein